MRAALLVAAAMMLPGCVSNAPGSVEEPLPQPIALSAIVHDVILREASSATSSVDGVALRVDVWRPDTTDPVPVILVQSPYWSFLGDAKSSDRPTWYIEYFVPRGYAVALGEMRGTRESGGCWDFGGPLDQQDGHDMVEHLAAMPWSNGNVGMLGQSHVGMSQVAAAVTAPPSLKTIVPIAAVTDWYRYLHKDGAPYVLNRATPPAYFAVHASPSDPPGPAGDGDDPVGWLLTQAQVACDDNVVHVSQSAELDGNKDAYWQERDLIAKAGQTQASVFLVHGFLDENVKTDHFLDYWDALPEDLPKKAWYGQWYHEHPRYLEWRNDLHAWYDHFLKGIDNGILDEPRITVQDNRMMNRTEEQWPGDARWQQWTAQDGNVLAKGPAGGTGAFQIYLVPGDDRGAVDQDAAQGFQAFITEPLAAAVHLTGEGRIDFLVNPITPNPHFSWAVFDVAPDGSRDEITRGYLSGPHADDLAAPAPMDALEDKELSVALFPRDHVVVAGHRIELVAFGGDMGCQTGYDEPPRSPYVSTCEGTGIIVDEPNDLLFTLGDEGVTLHVQVVDAPGPERALTPLENWLDALPA